MIFPFFILLIYLIYIDQDLFRQKDEGVARRIFVLTPYTTGLIALTTVLSVVIFIASERYWGVFPFLFILFLLPVYLNMRRNFVEQIIQASDLPEQNNAALGKNFAISYDAIGVVMVWLFSFVLITLIVKMLNDVLRLQLSEISEIILMTVVSFLVILRLVYQASQRFSDKGFWYNVGFRPSPRPKGIVLGTSLVLGLFFAVIASVIIFSRQIQPITPLSEALETTQSSMAMAAFLFLGLLTAPLIEEILFRGYFFQVMCDVKGQTYAIVFISLIFGVLHYGQYWGDWWAMGVVTVLGFALTLIRAWSGTTLSSTIFHYTYNIGVTVIPVVFLLFNNAPYLKYTVYSATYDTAQKEKLLLQSLEKDPNLLLAKNDLAWLYAEEQRHLDQARVLIEQALAKDPDNVIFLDTKAEVLYQSGHYDDAVALRKSLMSQEKTSAQMKEFLKKRLEEMSQDPYPSQDPQ